MRCYFGLSISAYLLVQNRRLDETYAEAGDVVAVAAAYF